MVTNKPPNNTTYQQNNIINSNNNHLILPLLLHTHTHTWVSNCKGVLQNGWTRQLRRSSFFLVWNNVLRIVRGCVPQWQWEYFFYKKLFEKRNNPTWNKLWINPIDSRIVEVLSILLSALDVDRSRRAFSYISEYTENEMWILSYFAFIFSDLKYALDCTC